MYNQELANQLLNSLNEQGFLFQEACTNDLRSHCQVWSVRASEYPVRFLDQDTRIDIVLVSTCRHERFVIVECKRADPDYQCWLFSGDESDYQSSADCHLLCIECKSTSSNSPIVSEVSVKPMVTDVPTHIAHSWVEVKVKPKQTGRNSSPQSIESALGQVLRGTSGFAGEQLIQRAKANQPFITYFIPIVITTASLYLARYNLRDIDMATGKIQNGKVSFGNNVDPEEQPWILVHYGATESVASYLIPKFFYDTDPKELMKHKLRSIFIVNSRYLVDFFNKLGFA